jgi:hypothetical protein
MIDGLEEYIADALRMVDVFVSVGSMRFDVTRTDVNCQRRDYRPGRNVAAMRLVLPHLVGLSWELHQNLIIRPEKPARGVLAQLDDLDAGQLERVHAVAFLLVETSPRNHQAWLAIENGTDDFVRRLVRTIGVDWNASRAVRIAGSPNCKTKYAPDFPVVRIVGSCPGSWTTPAVLESFGLVADEPVPRAALRVSARVVYRSGPRGWPDYDYCLRVAYGKKDGTIDRSGADCLWCKFALERGQVSESVGMKLLEVSGNAREEWDRGNEQYVWRTVKAAMKRLRFQCSTS